MVQDEGQQLLILGSGPCSPNASVNTQKLAEEELLMDDVLLSQTFKMGEEGPSHSQ